jgi:hypothetical protein
MNRPTRASLAFAGLLLLAAPAMAEQPHLRLELNKAEQSAANCRLTFRITNRFPVKLDDINVEIYFTDKKGVVMQSVQFPFAGVAAGKSRFARFDVNDTACTDIGGMFVNEFKSCKGPSDMAEQCRDTLVVTNLTALTFSDGEP